MQENDATPTTTEAPIEVEATASTVADPQPALPNAAQATDRSAFDLVIDLPVQLAVEVGRTQLLLRDVLGLGNGSVLELDRGSNEPADVYVNGRLIARGDLTAIDDQLAIRIVELVAPSGKASEES